MQRLVQFVSGHRIAALTCGVGVVVLAVAIFFAADRWLLDSGSDGNTIVQCIQGRCIEVSLDELSELEILTVEEEIERLGREPPTFKEVGAEAGVAFQHSRDDGFFNLGGGAAAADFNNDGWLDIYVTNSAGPNALYRNDGNGRFTDMAAMAGVTDPDARGHGAAWGDYDNDGFADLYVANWGASKLFRNNGDETFTDVTAAAGVGEPDEGSRGTGAVWGDYDQDGLLDLLAVRHVDAVGPLFTVETTAAIVLLRQCGTQEFYDNPVIPRGVVIGDSHDFTRRATRNFDGGTRSLSLFRNQGDGTFVDMAHLLGDGVGYPNNLEGAAFKPAFVDYDGDGDLDVYVVNDFGYENTPNVLWRNDGPAANGEWFFTDVSEGSGASPPMFGMGLAAGDYDNDGDFDFYVTDIGDSRFFENRDGLFENVSSRTGTGRGRIPENGEVNLSYGWGTAFGDLDNDGWLDIYMAAGQMDSDPCSNLPHQPNAVFINKADGTFADVSATSGANDNGTSREVIVADFNADGALDIYVVNMGSMEGVRGIAHLYLNTKNVSGHWLQIQPTIGEHGMLAVGARVEVTVGGLTYIRQAGLAEGHMSQSLLPVHFGLGDADKVDRVEITWPSGKVKRLNDVDADQLLVVEEPG